MSILNLKKRQEYELIEKLQTFNSHCTEKTVIGVINKVTNGKKGITIGLTFLTEDQVLKKDTFHAFDGLASRMVDKAVIGDILVLYYKKCTNKTTGCLHNKITDYAFVNKEYRSSNSITKVVKPQSKSNIKTVRENKNLILTGVITNTNNVRAYKYRKENEIAFCLKEDGGKRVQWCFTNIEQKESMAFKTGNKVSMECVIVNRGAGRESYKVLNIWTM